MDVEVTQKTAKLAKRYKLSPEQMAFADLIAVGWEPEDAWAMAIRKGVTWSRKALKEEISQLSLNPAIRQRIDDTQAVLKKNQIEAVKNTSSKEQQMLIDSAMSKEQMLYDLQSALKGKDAGSSEWLKIKQLIVDVTRMKQDEIKDENVTIHHYLPVDYPVSCEFCLRSRCDECRYKKACEDGE